MIAVPELMRQSETVAGQSFQPIEVYTFAMLVYFLMLFRSRAASTASIAASRTRPVVTRARSAAAMTLDWSVVWQHRDALAAGTATTFLLTIATMAIAVPCGIARRGAAPVRARRRCARSPPRTSSSSATCR